MKRFLAPGLAACALLALAGCNDVAFTVVCPGGATPSVLLTVLEGSTGNSVAAVAGGRWSVGETTDSLRHVTVDGTARLAAFGPAGTYSIVVRHAGFGTWLMHGVVVPGDECGPGLTELTATLFPASGGGELD